MKVNKLMLAGIIQNLKEEISSEYIGQGVCYELLYKLEKHTCPHCQKNEWFYCSDACAPFFACHTRECMLRDSSVTRKQQEDRNIKDQKSGWYFKKELSI